MVIFFREARSVGEAFISRPLPRVCLLGVLVSLLLSGCARYRERPLSAEQALTVFESRSLEVLELKEFMEAYSLAELTSWPLAEWNFTNLTLAAFYFHPDLDAARARWITTQSGEMTAGQRPNPSVGAAPGYNSSRSIPTPWFVDFTLDIPIETAGKRGYRVAQAQHLSEEARLNLASTAWQVRGRLRLSLVNLLEAREAVVLTQKQWVTLNRQLTLLKSQWEAGAISAVEVSQARLVRDRTQIALHSAEQQRDIAFADVAAAIGLPMSRLAGAKISFSGLTHAPPELHPDEVRHQALVNRTDILGALAAYAASESGLQLEMAKQYPDLRFSPGYQYDQGENKWSLGLSVDLPILNQNQGPIAEAEARRAEAAARFIALQAQVVAELDRRSAFYAAARAKVDTAEALFFEQTKQQTAAQARLAAGDISELEVALAEFELDQAALVRLQALAEVQRAYGALEQALQSPLLMTANLWAAPVHVSLTTTSANDD